MPPIGTWPAVAVLLGAVGGGYGTLPPHGRPVLIALLVMAVVSWLFGYARTLLIAVLAGFAVAAALIAEDARERALHSDLRLLLNSTYPGFDLAAAVVETPPPPLLTRFELTEDAAGLGDVVAMPARVLALHIDGRWQRVRGEGVRLTVGGAEASSRLNGWRAGRTLTAPVLFRRPARFLNDGVDDFERSAALDDTVLLGSIKSGLLVETVADGSRLAEAAADVRRHVRKRTSRYVAPHDATADAIVTAVLIGDRTGLADDVRTRLQKAGTYHVIAISGGNIAILAGLVTALLLICGIRGRVAAGVTILVLAAYALIVTAGPSVWRATLMAMLYFCARLVDHRTSPWQAMAVAVAALVLLRPLDIGDPGFVLTFGATAALLEGARRVRGAARTRQPLASKPSRWRMTMSGARRWVAASLLASVAVEIALAPVGAQAFSRVTAAGVVLNLLAVPLMAIVQAAGLVLVCMPGPESVARLAGWTAYAAADALVESARLVDIVPSLSRRVPPPGMLLIAVYYGGLAVVLAGRRAVRSVGGVIVMVAAFGIVSGLPAHGARAGDAVASELRLTMLDVGQAEAIVIEAPGAAALLVDTGGVPFGNGGPNVGRRVVAPALWARGIRSLGALLVTHGDPDHLGGGTAVVDDFSPRLLWSGIAVPSHTPMRALMTQVSDAGGRLEELRAGGTRTWGGARIRVLHPPEPDWERPRVRNDDSVVLEITFGNVSVLLTGDISADIERQIVPRLPTAKVRILKVAHHGSRTSSSAALLEAWRPHIALVSCGRGNQFGHPAREVLQRLTAVGARIYRTDEDGQVTVDTDGESVRVRTWMESR